MKLFETPLEEYFTRATDHLSDFWVPIVVAVIFLILAINEIKNRQIRLVILYLFLFLCSLGYLACGDEILGALTDLIR